MEKLNLFDAARKRVSMVSPGSTNIDIDKAVKQHFGLDRPSVNSKCLSDQVFSLIEKACEKGYSYVKPSSQKLDPVNEYAQKQLGINSLIDKGRHPMDAAYDFIESSIKTNNKDVKPSCKMDAINDMKETLMRSSDNSINSLHPKSEVITLLANIYKTKTRSSKSSLQQGPENELMEIGGLSGRFPSDPARTLNEWKTLITNILGPDPVFVGQGSVADIINDVAADQFGYERPSAKALIQVEDKLLEATYQLAYQLIPGSTKYNNKSKEIDLLKEERKKLQDNLNELNK